MTFAVVRLALPAPGRARLAALWALVLFPAVSAMARHVSLYDGMRHMLFIVPPMAVLAAAGWEFLLRSTPRPGFAVVAGAMALMLAEPVVFQIRNHPNQAVYFTPAIGGPRGAFGRYDLDYWGNCILEATEWAAPRPGARAFRSASRRTHGKWPRWMPGGFNELYFRQQRHAGWHLNLLLLKGSTENIAEIAADPGVLYRVQTADGTPLCVVLPGPDYPQLEGRSGVRPSACRGGRDGAMSDLQARTIADFGEQWTEYPDSDGFFGSVDLFNDIFRAAPLGRRRRRQGGRRDRRRHRPLRQHPRRRPERRASSPSNRPTPFACCRRTTAAHRDRITYLRLTGDQLPPSGDLDYVFVIGVLHHIPEPDPVVAASFKALKPGGKVAVWLYGREGNSMYLLLVRTLWLLTRRLPHRLLEWCGGGAVSVLLVLHDRVPLAAATARRSTCAASCCR